MLNRIPLGAACVVMLWAATVAAQRGGAAADPITGTWASDGRPLLELKADGVAKGSEVLRRVAQSQTNRPAARNRTGTVLITGANRGLGLEFAKQYATAGWSVIATARNPDAASELRALAAKESRVSIENLDVLDTAAIEALAAKYRGRPIDVLLNNAGVLGDMKLQALGSFDYAEFEEVMAARSV